MAAYISNNHHSPVEKQEEDECPDELEYFTKRFVKSIQKRYGHDEKHNTSISSKRYNYVLKNSMTRDEELEYLSKQAEKNFASIQNAIRDEELEKLHQRSKQFLAWRDEQGRTENKCDSSDT